MGSCCCELSRFIPLYRLPFFLVVGAAAAAPRRVLLVGGADPLFPLLFFVVLLGTGVRLLGATGVAFVAVVLLPCLVRLLRFFSPFFGMFGALGTFPKRSILFLESISLSPFSTPNDAAISCLTFFSDTVCTSCGSW